MLQECRGRSKEGGTDVEARSEHRGRRASWHAVHVDSFSMSVPASRIKGLTGFRQEGTHHVHER